MVADSKEDRFMPKKAKKTRNPTTKKKDGDALAELPDLIARLAMASDETKQHKIELEIAGLPKEEVVARVLACLADHPEHRRLLPKILFRLADKRKNVPGLMEALRAALRDADPEVWAKAEDVVWALGWGEQFQIELKVIRERKFYLALEAARQWNSPPYTQYRKLVALAGTPWSEKARELFVHALGRTNALERYAGAIGLAFLGDTSHIEGLRRVLDEAEPHHIQELLYFFNKALKKRIRDDPASLSRFKEWWDENPDEVRGELIRFFAESRMQR